MTLKKTADCFEKKATIKLKELNLGIVNQRNFVTFESDSCVLTRNIGCKDEI